MAVKHNKMILFGKVFLRSSAAALLVFGQVTAVSAAIDNTATVNGVRPDSNPAYSPGSEPSDSESVTVETKDAQFSANKSVFSIGDEAGEDIVYRVTLVNTGNVTIDTLSVTDPGPIFGGVAGVGTLTSPAIFSESVVPADGVLQVGETIIYEFTYTMTQADIDNAAGVANSVDNTAAVTAQDPDNVNVVPSGTLTIETTIPDNSALTLLKQAYDDAFATGPGALIGATPQALGANVYYRFTVTNTGNTTITAVEITEDTFSGSDPMGAIELVGGTTTTPLVPVVTQADLAPGETAIFEVQYTVTQTDIDNQ